jgi:phytoene dehydrogenase-like protein
MPGGTHSATPDAVVIGAGPNGLVAANILADAAWDVVVCEEQAEPGGAVRSGAGPADGFVSDHCSAFYPMAAASRAITSLELERYGLRWTHAPAVLAHPLRDGRAAVLCRDLDQTVAGLDELGPGDGAAWRRLHERWENVGSDLLDALFVPFPPVRPALRLAAKLKVPGLLRFLRFGLLPVRKLIEEEFSGPGSLLLAGCALHADLMPESAASSFYGWLLAMLGHQYGWPVPEGGSGQLSAAMARRLRDRGGSLRCADGVREVVVRRGRAVAVRTASGEEIPARRAVLAATSATQLYGGLVAWEHLPARLRDNVCRVQWDYSTFTPAARCTGPAARTRIGPHCVPRPPMLNAWPRRVCGSASAADHAAARTTPDGVPARAWRVIGPCAGCARGAERRQRRYASERWDRSLSTSHSWSGSRSTRTFSTAIRPRVPPARADNRRHHSPKPAVTA